MILGRCLKRGPEVGGSGRNPQDTAGRPIESLAMNGMECNVIGTAVYGTVRTVAWGDGGRKPASYPIADGAAVPALPLHLGRSFAIFQD